MALIYEGDVLFAHHNPGKTPYLLVTFVGLYHEHEADTSYLMRELVEREGMACVGVTSRLRNFYLHHEIETIAALVRSIREPDQKVILIGQSSGGFAAAKFATLFSADAVLAFSPVFSADETDLGLTEDMQREIAFLRGATRLHRIDPQVVRPGMRPGPEDCAVPLFIVYDPGNENDAWAADCFVRTLEQTRPVRCTDLGHTSFTRIMDEQGHHLATMLERLAAGDEDAASGWLRHLARRSESTVAALLLRIARWRPWEVERALRTERARTVLTDATRQRHQFNDVMVFEYIKRNRVADALAHLRTLHPTLFGGPDNTVAPGKFLVLSYHGDFMTFKPQSEKITMIPQALFNREYVPLILDTSGGQARLMLPMRNGERVIDLDPDSATRNGSMFDLVPIRGTGLTAFKRGDAYLTADYAATPLFGASWHKEWEWFALVPVACPAAFAKDNLNWFDRISLGAANNPDLTASVTPSRNSFRSILQRYFR